MQIRCPKCKTVQSAEKQAVDFCKGCGVRFEPITTSFLPSQGQFLKNGGAVVIIFLIAIVLIIGLLWKIKPKKSQSKQTVLTAVSATPDNKNDVERWSLALVGFDDGGIAPDKNDKRVARAKVLLSFFAEELNTTPLDVSFGADEAVNFVQRQYGADVSRLQMLENYRKFYLSLDGKTKTAVKSEKFKDTLKLYALFKYEK